MARLGDPADVRLLVLFLRSIWKWSQEQLAKASGVDRGLISDYELGLKVPRQRTLERLAAAVGLPYSWVETLDLEEGRTSEVKSLAEEMFWIFDSQGVADEALAAIRLFCEAAKKEEPTAELARRMVAYLQKAQHQPELRFEAERLG
jgi:transcriptional regulator with XRE-family HTH domain